MREKRASLPTERRAERQETSSEALSQLTLRETPTAVQWRPDSSVTIVKFSPRTGHKSPEVEQCIALLFLQPRR